MKQNLNINQVRLFTTSNMFRLHDGQIQCRMSSTSKLAEGEVAFYVQSGTGHALQECMSSQRIHVMPNPVVRSVHRNEVPARRLV